MHVLLSIDILSVCNVCNAVCCSTTSMVRKMFIDNKKPCPLPLKVT